MSLSTNSSSDAELNDDVHFMSQPTSLLARKRPKVSEDFYDELLCQICYDYFTPPVIQCERGHSFWKKCVDRLPPQQKRCPVCRNRITKTRNFTIEAQLEKLSTRCQYHERGCKARISLGERSMHEEECDYQPKVCCYYEKNLDDSSCFWTGPSEELAKHLQDAHDVICIERDKVVKFLWTPPIETASRVRYRILNMLLQMQSPVNFVLEHWYEAESKKVMFLVRTLNPDFKVRYKIQLLNRFDAENYLTFEGETLSFEDYGHILDTHQNNSGKRLFQVPLDVLRDFVFYNEEDDDSYFSLVVEFKA